MKAVLRGVSLLVLSALVVPASFANDAAKKKARPGTKSGVAAKAATDSTAAKESTPALPVGKSTPFALRSGLPQGSTGAGSAGNPAGGKQAPELRPMPSSTGGIGVFTVDSAYLLPKGGISAGASVNKFARNPGSVSIVELGTHFGYAFTDWFNAYVQFDPHRHVHIGRPAQLSLRTPAGNPPFPDAVNPTIFRGLLPGPPGSSAPGYVEDFPFVNRNEGGVGEVQLAVKFGLLSEYRGHPFSLAVMNTFIIPTARGLTDLLDNQVQMGQFSDKISIMGSRTWWKDRIVSSSNLHYRFTRDPRSGPNNKLFHSADQLTLGGGTIFMPKWRVQPMMETVFNIFVGKSTQNTSFGPRVPIDSVWGVRMYPWRNVSVDVGYRRTNAFRNDIYGDPNGFVFKLNTVYWPEKAKPVNRMPAVSCSADRASVIEGSGETIGVRAMGSDPDNDTLTYRWTATGGSVEGSGPAVRWNPGSARRGTYTVTATVDDGHGGTASCSADVGVAERPNRPPTLSCSVDRSSVITGERVRVTGAGSDPDGEALTYSWRTNGGQIVGSGSSVTLDTTGLNPGRYTVTGRAEDPRGAAADCSVSVEVNARPAPPQASKISECFFRVGSARVDNVCKRVLDDVAVRLQNDPRARVVIIGYADPKEPRSAKLGQSRGDEAKKYLASKGVAAGRIDVRAAGGQAGADKQNRRVDVIYVPEGATY